jgi:alkylation response protein AidB-like acyl-CoA dehydrogenase
MQTTSLEQPVETLRTLPGDEVRAIMWRYAERYEMQMMVQAARSVGRGIVARLVAEGERNSHDWTTRKSEVLTASDQAGLTGAFMEPSQGGLVEGPKNLLLSLIALELAWVDGGAATSSMAVNLALAPIVERGTPEQRDHYMKMCCPPPAGEERAVWRGAFALTEPLPYVGVETGLVSGKIRVAEWKEGEEPILHVDKRGRFITNMGFANFVTAAVDSDDKRFKGSCMVILHDSDPGLFDRGTPTKKLVHQLSSTCDPVLSVKVPASRIIGGYTIKEGVVVPNFNHSEIIEAVFRRTRVTVGLMTAAKLLSSVEPVIRYQRGRFRGGESVRPGTPRYDLGLQTKEDVLHRLVDVWATGEAAASLGFATARLFDELDPMERQKDAILEEKKIPRGRAQFKAMAAVEKEALQLFDRNLSKDKRVELESNLLVQYALRDCLANVVCPACKLWNTGYGANVMREAVSLMGGYGITEDCPGFLAQKWMDAQLEATYEGPEAVQRRQMSLTMTNELFLAQFGTWILELRQLAASHPDIGACTLATAMQLWLTTLKHLQEAVDADGAKLYSSNRQGVTFPLADALCFLLAVRYQIMDVLELERQGPENPAVAEGLPGLLSFLTDLCHVQAARSAGEVGRIAAELVYGYNRHPGARKDCCRSGSPDAEDLQLLAGIVPGITSSASSSTAKSEPCHELGGLETFARLRHKLDLCLSGSRLSKDRAAEALTKVMIPEALDYPL